MVLIHLKKAKAVRLQVWGPRSRVQLLLIKRAVMEAIIIIIMLPLLRG
jgi:hypothetical protein